MRCLLWTDNEDFVVNQVLKLDKVVAVRLQMGDWAASTTVFVKFGDAEVHKECRLWEVVEVPESVGLTVLALHLTKCSLQITHPGQEGV